jgi:hypothetical protein
VPEHTDHHAGDNRDREQRERRSLLLGEREQGG